MTSKLFTSMVRIALLVFFFLLFFFPDIFGIRIEYPGFPLTDALFLRLCKTAFWLLVAMEILRSFYYGIIKEKKKGVAANLLSMVVPVLLLLVVLEIAFMYIPQSHEGVLSKASQIWWSRYWHPVNTLGYRDREPSKNSTEKQVLFIGDSFTAGHGLKHTEDRFSDIFGTRVGGGYRVHNLGISGSDSGDEAARLEAYPVKPDVIVLQYFPNDIERVARNKGLSLSAATPYNDLNRIGTHLVRRFYLPNFIYWQLPHTQFSTFDEFVNRAYNDTTVLNAHLRDLDRIVAYSRKTGARMYAVFIPFLFQLEKSAGYTRKVETFLRDRGVGVVTLEKEIARVPEKDRIVGKNDGHASVKINRLIAEKLEAAFKKPPGAN